MILRERDPVEHFAPLLGPRVGLRARRPVEAALCAPFTFTMPPSGTILVTFIAGEEPRWNVEALCGMGVNALKYTQKCAGKPVAPRNAAKRRLTAMLNVLAKPRPRPQDMGHPGRAMNGGR